MRDQQLDVMRRVAVTTQNAIANVRHFAYREPEDLLAEAHALAQSLLQNSPQAMRAVKELLARHSASQLDEEIEGAIAANALQRSTEDFREGVRAFLEHRRPAWPSVDTHAKEHEHVKV